MDKLKVYKKYFETAKDDSHLVLHRGYALALVEMVEELQRRIDKVTAECGVNWINEVLKGEEPKRTELIHQLGEKACDRNDDALKKMED